MKTMLIGEVARRAQVRIDTVRYYERRGLIPEPMRRESGYREFPAETVERIRFIRRAKRLGFTLTEIKQLLALAGNKAVSCEEVREFATDKLAKVQQQLRDLRRVKQMLADLLERCVAGGSPRGCPILESLQTSGHSD